MASIELTKTETQILQDLTNQAYLAGVHREAVDELIESIREQWLLAHQSFGGLREEHLLRASQFISILGIHVNAVGVSMWHRR